MAFTTADKIAIVKTLGTSFDALNSHLTWRAGDITTDIVSAVLIEITAFNAIANDGVEVFPTATNFGARISRSALRDERRENIRNLLNFYPLGVAESTSTRLVRS